MATKKPATKPQPSRKQIEEYREKVMKETQKDLNKLKKKK